jgi:hypothetical protein
MVVHTAFLSDPEGTLLMLPKQPISRVLSPVDRVMVIHLCPTFAVGSCGLTRSVLPNFGDLRGPLSKRNLFGLAPGGVFQAAPVTRDTGELLPSAGIPADPPRRAPFHPYPDLRGGFPFCGTFLPVTGTLSYRAPCPLELGLSSRRQAGDHLFCFGDL